MRRSVVLLLAGAVALVVGVAVWRYVASEPTSGQLVVREIEGALEFVVPMHSPHRMLVRVVKAHFPNAPSGMRWCVASSVRTRDQRQSRTTFAGYPEKLRADAREDEISANSVPCVLDMALNTPWYNAILL